MNQSLKGPEGLRLYKATSKLRVHDSYTKSDIKYKTSGTKSPILNCRTGNRIDPRSEGSPILNRRTGSRIDPRSIKLLAKTRGWRRLATVII